MVTSEETYRNDIRNLVAGAYFLVGASSFLFLLRSSATIYLVWLTGVGFTSLLLYYRRNLPPAQKGFLYIGIAVYTIGTMAYLIAMVNALFTAAQMVIGHSSNGTVDLQYFIKALGSFLPIGIVYTAILGSGVSFWFLGSGMVSGLKRIYYTLFIAISTSLMEASLILAFRNEVAILSSGGHTVNVQHLKSYIGSTANFYNLSSPAVLALSIAGSLLLALVFFYIGYGIRNGSIELHFREAGNSSESPENSTSFADGRSEN